MSVLAIACDNCGAKYRLPESFSGDKAKCQKCGSVIDVAAQRKAAAAPAPIAAAPKETPAPKKAAPVRASKTEAKTDAAPAARSRRATAEPKADAKPGRGRKDVGEREPKKSNTMLLAGGGIAALAIVAVIVVLASGGKDKAKTTEAAQAAAAPKAAEATPEAKGTAEAATANAKPAAAEAAAQKAAPAAVDAASAPVAQDKKPAPEAPKETPAESKQPEAQPAQPKTPEAKPTEDKPTGGGEAKERWEANKTTKLEDVYKPTELGDVTWPAECEQAQKDEIVSLIDDICNGGKPGVAAKPKLEKIGYYAIFGLVDRLRKLDYTSGDDQMTAWELNKSIEAIAAGMNAGFVAVEVGGDLDPRKADHNARTNIAWSRLLTKFTGKADFDTWRKERASKNK